MEIDNSKPRKEVHPVAVMRMLRGGIHYGGGSYGARFTCPVCDRFRTANRNWLGHGAQVTCTGVKTVILRGEDRLWVNYHLATWEDFGPTAPPIHASENIRCPDLNPKLWNN